MIPVSGADYIPEMDDLRYIEALVEEWIALMVTRGWVGNDGDGGLQAI